MKLFILTISLILMSCGGENANISLSGQDIKPLTEIDRTKPFITNFSILKKSEPATNPSNTDLLFFIIHFSEPVTNITIDQFEVYSDSVDAEISYIDEVGDNGQSYIISVQEISGNGEISLKVIDDYSIEDESGNLLDSSVMSESWVIDHKIPTMLAIGVAENTNNPTYRIFFSERVYNIESSEFELITEEGNLRARIDEIIPTDLNSGIFAYDVSLKNISGSGRLRLDFNHSSSRMRDYAGNKIEQNYLRGSAIEL